MSVRTCERAVGVCRWGLRWCGHAWRILELATGESVMARFAIPEGWSVQAYRFALHPTAAQEQALRSHAGARHFAYNAMLAAVKANLNQRAAEKTYGLHEDELTSCLGWSMHSLRNEWNRIKHAVAVRDDGTRMGRLCAQSGCDEESFVVLPSKRRTSRTDASRSVACARRGSLPVRGSGKSGRGHAYVGHLRSSEREVSRLDGAIGRASGGFLINSPR